MGERIDSMLTIWQAQIICLTIQDDKIKLHFKIIKVNWLTILQTNLSENYNKLIENKIKSWINASLGNFSHFSHSSDFFNFSYWYQEQAPDFAGNKIGFYDYNNFRNIMEWKNGWIATISSPIISNLAASFTWLIPSGLIRKLIPVQTE